MKDIIEVRFWATHKEDGPLDQDESVTRKRFVTELLYWLDAKRTNGVRHFDSKRYSEADGRNFDNIFHWRLISDFKPEEYESITCGPDELMSPRIQAHMSENWAYVEFEVTGENEGNINLARIFTFRSAAGRLEEVALPKDLTTDKEDHYPDLRGEGILYPAGRFPWPLPIIEPERYEELGRLYFEIERIAASLNGCADVGKTNPLDILRKSPQPYKGLAEQVTEKIEDHIKQLDQILEPVDPSWKED